MKKHSKVVKYDHLKIEKKWQKEWAKSGIYKTKESANLPAGRRGDPKYYVLDMFPYPSGEGLHVGHPKGYIATDIYSRFKRMNGFNVLHPMGWDAFGLPAENYAIKNKIHPELAVKKNIKYFKSQLEKIGFDYDWSREINTTDPKFYKWTQWIFLQLYKKGLAYESYEPINWCPSCQTGLANEDLENGKCERCGSEVEKKPMRQWVLKITNYADRLLKDLDDLDWPESIKESQKNWIGRSEGSEISFPLKTKYRFVFLHGWKGNGHNCFFPWLKRELEAHGHEVITLDLPHSYIPDVVEQAEYVLSKVKFDENTILLGHSLGSVVAYRILERLNKPIRKLILVAGLIEPKFRDKERLAAKYLMSWKFNVDKIKKNASKVVILEDVDDIIISEGQSRVIQQKLGGLTFQIKANKAHVCGTIEPAVLEHCLDEVKVFTTRADTLFGATYLVIAPEHPLIENLADRISNLKEVRQYVKKAGKQTEIERTAEGREKTGIRLEGLTAINPAGGREIPIWVADYVLPDYGTGAIMAVPAHDERDYQFAVKFNLPIIQVIAKDRVPVKSYLMGAREITDTDLEAVGAQVVEKRPDGDRLLILDPKKLSAYEKLITEKMSPGFWNEYNSAGKAVFIFKDKKGKVTRYVLSPENEEEIDKLAAKYVGEDWDKKNVWKWLADNDWYRDLIIHTEEGKLVNSGKFNNLSSAKAKRAITKFVRGQMTVKYKLRDWVFSRQRYWGEPIPIIHCPKCGLVPVAETNLPVKLPKVKSYAPTGTGESPLSGIKDWVNVKCPICGEPAKRETNTMPQWAGSSWYYLRYLDPDNKQVLVDKKEEAYWSPVDMYVGGTEHATRHLIYARFWHKFLYDLGLVSQLEPFARLKNQGLIAGADGRKMSKRWGNVINPDDIVKNYGADTLRIYEMFMGPFSQGASWSTGNLMGARRFIEKIWRLAGKVEIVKREDKKLTALLHKTIKQVSADIDNFDFNTAISAMMILVNNWDKAETVSATDFKTLLKLLAPFAPHLADELWHNFGLGKSIHLENWPAYDPQKLVSDNVTLVIQINGKMRDSLVVPAGLSQEGALELALASAKVAKWLTAEKPRKIIYIADRLLNLVV